MNIQSKSQLFNNFTSVWLGNSVKSKPFEKLFNPAIICKVLCTSIKYSDLSNEKLILKLSILIIDLSWRMQCWILDLQSEMEEAWFYTRWWCEAYLRCFSPHINSFDIWVRWKICLEWCCCRNWNSKVFILLPSSPWIWVHNCEKTYRKLNVMCQFDWNQADSLIKINSSWSVSINFLNYSIKISVGEFIIQSSQNFFECGSRDISVALYSTNNDNWQ